MTSPASSKPSPAASRSSDVIEAEWAEVSPDTAPSASSPEPSRPAAPLVLRPRPLPPAKPPATARGRGKAKVLCSTCQRPTSSFVTARVGPITLPICQRCAGVAEVGVKLLHHLFR
jgi:hypothetical protein